GPDHATCLARLGTQPGQGALSGAGLWDGIFLFGPAPGLAIGAAGEGAGCRAGPRPRERCPGLVEGRETQADLWRFSAPGAARTERPLQPLGDQPALREAPSYRAGRKATATSARPAPAGDQDQRAGGPLLLFHASGRPVAQ